MAAARRRRRARVPDAAVHDCAEWTVFPERVCLKCAWATNDARRARRRRKARSTP